MLPSAVELEYFLEVAHVLNLSRASERLGISQPSLSLAIKRLEKTIAAPLFIRHKNGVTLTQAGKQLLNHVRQLLQYWKDTKTRALASHNEIQGYYTLGCHTSIAIYLVSKFLGDLLEEHPKLELHLQHDLSRKISEQIINLSIDIGLVINPIKHPDLVIQKIADDEIAFWVGSGNKKIQDIYSDQAVILCDSSLSQTQSLLTKCKKAGISPSRIMSINNLEVIASLTANGSGIGILPSRVATATYPNKLKKIEKMPIYNDSLCIIYRHENRNLLAIQAVISAIKKSINH